MDNRNRGQPNIPGNTMSPLPSGIPAMSFNRFDGVEFDDMEFDFYSQPTMMQRTDSGTTTLSGGTTFSDDSGYGSQPPCSNYYYYSPQNAGYYGDNNTYHQYDDQTQQQQEQYVTGTGSQYEASHAAPGPSGKAQQYTTTPGGTYIQFKEEDFFAAAAEIHGSGVAPFYGEDQPGQSQYTTAAAAAQAPPTLSGGYRSAQYAGTSPTAASPAAQANPRSSPGRADGNSSSSGSTRAATAAAAEAAAASANQAGKFPCLWANCPSKAFGRAADLDRHLKMVHFKDTHPGTPCDYRRCGRRRQPFHRLDHFRDHLREFHKEDLPRRGQAEGAQWWASRAARAVYEGWWRCNRCLGRVAVGEDGYVCPGCGSHCEVERQRVRGLPVGCDHGGECQGAEFYRHDHLRAHLRECHGEDLPLLAQKEQNDAGRELDSEEWWRSRTIYLGWWRCNRCMARVEEEQSGWECPACSNPCEEERVAARTMIAQ